MLERYNGYILIKGSPTVLKYVETHKTWTTSAVLHIRLTSHQRLPPKDRPGMYDRSGYEGRETTSSARYECINVLTWLDQERSAERYERHSAVDNILQPYHTGDLAKIRDRGSWLKIPSTADLVKIIYAPGLQNKFFENIQTVLFN